MTKNGGFYMTRSMFSAVLISFATLTTTTTNAHGYDADLSRKADLTPPGTVISGVLRGDRLESDAIVKIDCAGCKGSSRTLRAGQVVTAGSAAGPLSAEREQVSDDVSNRLNGLADTLRQSIARETPGNWLSNKLECDIADSSPVIVIVDKSVHVTHVVQNHNGRLVSVFRAANTTGKMATPTPNGRMMIVAKQLDPEWKPPVSIDPEQKKIAGYSKDPRNPLGVAWLRLNVGCIGLHGTNNPRYIGRNASHGCVRHKNADIKKLYSMVPVGTPVYIVPQLSGTYLLSEDVAHLSRKLGLLASVSR